MLHHYLRTTLRHLLRRKGYTFINVTGLAVGTAACLLILLYVRHERSYDRFHEHADRMYRIVWMSERPQTRTPHPMAQALVRDFPEVEHAVSLSPIWGPGLTRPTFSIRYQDRRFDEREVFSADSTFFDVFTFPLVRGDAATALAVPGGVLLTQSAAARYFGAEDPVGKVLVVDDKAELTVTGVLADLPAESHFHFDFLVSYVTMKQGGGGSYYEWGDFGHYNYVVLAEGADPAAVEARLAAWTRQYVDWPAEAWAAYEAGRIGLRLQPVTDIHLRSHLMWELEPNGHVAYVYTFAAAALFILLIACVNFTNLATARAMDRAKEVGVRKAAGAARRQLALQFLGEAVLLAALAVGVAVVLVAAALPAFRVYAGVDLRPGGGALWAVLVAAVLGVGLLAGAYPAFVLSAFRPAQVLKGALRASPSGRVLRQGLVVVQFALSIALVIGTLVVSRQLHHLRTADLGFTAEQVVVLPLREAVRPRYEAVKEALREHPGVVAAAAVSNVPGGRFNQNDIRWAGQDERVSASELRADHDFAETLGLTLAAGRTFSRDHPADTAAFVVNEAAARHYRGASTTNAAVGEELEWDVEGGPLRGEVIGVVKDFHFQTLRDEVAPLVVVLEPGAFNYLLVRIRPTAVGATLAHLGTTMAAFDPAHPFTYAFLGHELEALYRQEVQVERVLGAFAGLALFIACLGLFGLATFAAEQRRKEIGVRKVLGATPTSLVFHLSKDFARLVVLAFVVAAPVAYLAMSAWLGDFASRIDLARQGGVFATAGLAALAVALVTVSYHAVRAATANPVDALRSE